MWSISPLWIIHDDRILHSVQMMNCLVMNRVAMIWFRYVSGWMLCFFLQFFRCKLMTFWLFVHYIEIFFVEGTKNFVHCSELAGVHYREAHLQLKTTRGDPDMRSNGRCSLTEVSLYLITGKRVFTLKSEVGSRWTEWRELCGTTNRFFALMLNWMSVLSSLLYLSMVVL